MGRKYKTLHNLKREGTIQMVPLGKMHIASRHAQREKVNKSRVDYLLSRFNLDKLGTIILSHRHGEFYIIDGQHRVETLKQWLGSGWEIQKIECLVYEKFIGSRRSRDVS